MRLQNQLIPKSLPLILSVILCACGTLLHAQNPTDLKAWVKNYAYDLSQDDWQERMPKYGWDGPWDKHQAFRNAYQDLSIDVKDVVTDGTNIMAWLEVSALWVGNFEKDVLRDAEPNGKTAKWEEVWNFNVIDGHLGGKWHIIGAEHLKMKSVGVGCLPESRDE